MKKLEQWLWYAFLIAIPFSVRHIFGFEAVGFMEWKAIALYGTDVLLAGLCAFWIVRAKTFRLRFDISDWVLVLFAGISALSIHRAYDVHVAWYHWVKLLEGMLLYWYIKNHMLKRFSLMHSFEVLVIGGVAQAVTGIVQFMTQHSLGLKYLGESILSPGMTGIAAFYSHGEKIMRAYGTTVHSNVLAGYLFLCLAAFLFISIYERRRWHWYVFHAVTLWAFFLTFSRTIIAIWLLNFVLRTILYRYYPAFKKIFWGTSEMKKRGVKIFVITILTGLVFVGIYHNYVRDRLVVSQADETVQLRVLYNHETLSAGVHWLGVGPGNFVPWLMRQPLPSHSVGLPPEQYQPVHNIYLLIYAETGLLGLVAFLAFLGMLIFEFIRRTKFHHPRDVSFMLVFCSVLVFGLFDHFLWTIQAGSLLFWLTAGLISAEPHV
jgi:hypothetical protein